VEKGRKGKAPPAGKTSMNLVSPKRHSFKTGEGGGKQLQDRKVKPSPEKKYELGPFFFAQSKEKRKSRPYTAKEEKRCMRDPKNPQRKRSRFSEKKGNPGRRGENSGCLAGFSNGRGGEKETIGTLEKRGKREVRAMVEGGGGEGKKKKSRPKKKRGGWAVVPISQ